MATTKNQAATDTYAWAWWYRAVLHMSVSGQWRATAEDQDAAHVHYILYVSGQWRATAEDQAAADPPERRRVRHRAVLRGGDGLRQPHPAEAGCARVADDHDLVRQPRPGLLPRALHGLPQRPLSAGPGQAAALHPRHVCGHRPGTGPGAQRGGPGFVPCCD